MPTFTSVTLTSENPKYNHTITVLVDNDLSNASTVVVQNTYFPYIVKLTGTPNGDTRRYISSWLYDKLINDYRTPLGKVLNTLDEEKSVYPYYYLDYKVFQDKINVLRAETVDERSSTVRENRIFNRFDYHGYNVGDFNIDPEFLLTWLDFPTTDAEGSPVDKFPDIIDYFWTTVYDVQVQVSFKPDVYDYYQNVYIIDIIHDYDLKTYTYAVDTYNSVSSQYNLSVGLYSRATKKTNIEAVSAQQSLSRMISKAYDPKLKTLIPNSGLTAAANSVLSKLNELNSLPALPKLPKLPRISLSKIVVDLKVKLKERKNIKRLKKSSKFNFSQLKKPSIKNPLSANAEKLSQSPRGLTSMVNSQLTTAKGKLNQVTSKV